MAWHDGVYIQVLKVNPLVVLSRGALHIYKKDRGYFFRKGRFVGRTCLGRGLCGRGGSQPDQHCLRTLN